MNMRRNNSSLKEVKRQLRSKENHAIDASLFNFEENPSVIDPETEMKVVGRVDDPEAVPLELDFFFDKDKIGFETNMVKIGGDQNGSSLGRGKGRSLRRSTIRRVGGEDPLSDEVYALYHRRMEKEEKKMFNRDREKLYADADKMKTQLEALQQNDWTRVLPTITYIRDARDHEELVQKREWTMNSLELLLSKFEDWKRRDDKVSGKSRAGSLPLRSSGSLNDLTFYTKLNKFDYVGNSDTDEEEESLSVQEIRSRRVRKRVKKFGPIIKIKFGSNVVVAKPFESTRIEKC